MIVEPKPQQPRALYSLANTLLLFLLLANKPTLLGAEPSTAVAVDLTPIPTAGRGRLQRGDFRGVLHHIFKRTPIFRLFLDFPFLLLNFLDCN